MIFETCLEIANITIFTLTGSETTNIEAKSSPWKPHVMSKDENAFSEFPNSQWKRGPGSGAQYRKAGSL